MIPDFLRHRPFLPLTTERLILRFAQKEDVTALVGLGFYTQKEAEDKIETSQKVFREGKSLFLVIEHLLDRKVMGILELGPYFYCTLGKKFQKKGYGYEAASAFIHFVFSLFKVEEIRARCPKTSPFLQKLGFCLKSGASKAPIFHLTRETFFKNLLCEKKRALVWIVVCALIRSDGALFLTRRQAHQSFPGAWELPGGKIESCESPEAAIIREMKEETGIVIAPHHLKALSFASHPYETLHIVVHFYACFQWKGEPFGKEGQEIAWVFPENIHLFPTPAVDIPLFHRLANELATYHPKWQAYTKAS